MNYSAGITPATKGDYACARGKESKNVTIRLHYMRAQYEVLEKRKRAQLQLLRKQFGVFYLVTINASYEIDHSWITN
jgi:hypothetical protein